MAGAYLSTDAVTARWFAYDYDERFIGAEERDGWTLPSGASA